MVDAIRRLNQKEYTQNSMIFINILLMVFVIGGLFGFIYEELFYRIDLGYFVKRGTTFGPWIPIYGFGAVFVVIGTSRLKKHPKMLFLVASTISGILEYVTGYVLLKYFDVRLWDYNVEIWNWLNIGGFVCFRSVMFFGLSAMILQYLVHPLLSVYASKCEKRVLILSAVIPAILFVLDILLSLLFIFKA